MAQVSTVSNAVKAHEVHRYKEWLKDRVDRGFYVSPSQEHLMGNLSDENVWGLKAGAPITQAVLDNAFGEQQQLLAYFKKSGINVRGRGSPKEWSEVRHARDQGFGAYKDALTIRCYYSTMGEAPTILAKVIELIKAVQGSKFIHYQRDPDIIQFIDWYHPGIGHTVHVQVLHAFAAIAQEQDARLELLRANGGGWSGVNAKHIDLWGEGLYVNVRDALLNPSAWSHVWHENATELWGGRLTRLIQITHNTALTAERREDDLVKRDVEHILQRAFNVQLASK
ncbi:MAG: hypothetical protein M1822_008175 [Bathelium mastoideum]|nr:MAG: hypothetical protein M1822_008175 [Bathelium mastoideum]